MTPTPTHAHSGPPPIPATCEHRPTIGGRVTPWVNVHLADGGIDFRSQHRTRVIEALSRSLCQVCGLPLGHPIVLLGGPKSLRQLIFGEPPLHPECAVYTSKACPVVAGERTHTPTGPSISRGKRGEKCFEPGCDCGGWVPSTPDDAGHEPLDLEPWYAVYASGFSIATAPDGNIIGALLSPSQVLVIRLISRPGQGRCWVNAPDALADYEAPTLTPPTADTP